MDLELEQDWIWIQKQIEIVWKYKRLELDLQLQQNGFGFRSITEIRFGTVRLDLEQEETGIGFGRELYFWNWKYFHIKRLDQFLFYLIDFIMFIFYTVHYYIYNVSDFYVKDFTCEVVHLPKKKSILKAQQFLQKTISNG